MISDILTVDDDRGESGDPLLAPVMRAGKLVSGFPSLDRSREHAAAELRRLPGAMRRLEDRPDNYPVAVSERLRELAREADRRTAAR